MYLDTLDTSVGARAESAFASTSTQMSNASSTAVQPTAPVLLVDIEHKWLDEATSTLKQAGYQRLESIEHDITCPFISTKNKVSLIMAWKGKAKSIALNFVLHCIEGTLRTKGGAAFSKLKRLLRKDGVLFGATILGACAPHTGFGRALMRRFNMPFKPSMSFSGIFANNLETTSTPRRTCLHCVHTLPSSKFGSWAARRFLRQPTTRCGSLSSFGDWGETYFWGQFRFWFLARSCENAVARPGAPFTLPPPPAVSPID